MHKQRIAWRYWRVVHKRRILAAITHKTLQGRYVSLLSELNRRGGIARASELQRRGWRRHHIRQALKLGTVMRPADGWIAHPDADPELVTAAQNASRLTCVTQARRLGLWDTGDMRLHLAPYNYGSRVEDAHVRHWAKPVMALDPWTLTDPVQNVLALVANCLPFEDAVTVWESALRQGLVRRERLTRLPYKKRALEVLRACTLYSDSGLESYVKTRCKRLQVRVLAQVYIEGHHVDFLLGDCLVLQIDGATHTGAQRTSDISHDATLMLLGYRVIRVGYEQVMHRWPDVFEWLLEAISQGLHRR